MHLRHSGPGGRGSVAEKERIESEGKAEAAETSTKRPHIGDKEVGLSEGSCAGCVLGAGVRHG
eukprot:1145861-Pelagomonas_calceolata.AAC.6